MGDLHNSQRIDLEFLRNSVDEVFDGALHQVDSSIVVFYSVLWADVEASLCESVSEEISDLKIVLTWLDGSCFRWLVVAVNIYCEEVASRFGLAFKLGNLDRTGR